MANGLTQTKWADHLRGCAEIANDIAKILDIREDSARQAMFATITIDAGKHNIFCEPIPESRINPEHTRSGATHTSLSQGKKERDDLPEVNKGAIQNPTHEQAEGASRTALLVGINSAREMIAKIDPSFTPAALNRYIAEKMKVDKNLGALDLDELAVLTEKLSKRLDVMRTTKSESSKLKEHLMDRQAEKSATADDLEDWP